MKAIAVIGSGATKSKKRIRIISDYGFSPFGVFGMHFYIYENDKLIKHLCQKDKE